MSVILAGGPLKGSLSKKGDHHHKFVDQLATIGLPLWHLSRQFLHAIGHVVAQFHRHLWRAFRLVFTFF